LRVRATERNPVPRSAAMKSGRVIIGEGWVEP
jgi:hypothetical protein